MDSVCSQVRVKEWKSHWRCNSKRSSTESRDAARLRIMGLFSMSTDWIFHVATNSTFSLRVEEEISPFSTVKFEVCIHIMNGSQNPLMPTRVGGIWWLAHLLRTLHQLLWGASRLWMCRDKHVFLTLQSLLYFIWRLLIQQVACAFISSTIYHKKKQGTLFPNKVFKRDTEKLSANFQP